MKLLIVGAAEAMGKALVREASKQDHQVTLFSREDTLEPGALDQPLQNQDAVICSLELERTREAVTLFSSGTENLIRAMQRHNVRKLFCITGVGTGDSLGHGGLWFDRVLQPLFLKTVYQDKTRQEKLIQVCDRDWMIIRPAQLTGGRARARFSVVQNTRGLLGGQISRADVAIWTIAQLNNSKYLYKSVVLTE